MPLTTYKYPKATLPDQAFSEMRLRAELAVAVGGTARLLSTRMVRIEGPTKAEELQVVYSDALTPVQKTALDGAIAIHRDDAHDLVSVRERKFASIDAKTRALISKGFEYGGIRFSLTDNAQKTLLGLDQLRDDPNMVYPVRYNALHDRDGSVVLATSADIHNFFMTGMAAFRAAWDSGTVLKEQVRAAATIEAVNAIIDNR